MLGLAPALGLACIATWLIVAAIFHLSSLAALAAAAAAPLYCWLLLGEATALVSVLAMSALLFYRHKSNIQKLLAGEETRIGKTG
jgi:glycerol-3-phosphate acyltransferase PlsY